MTTSRHATGTPTDRGRSLVWTIIVAAGAGSRFGGDVPKQFVEIAGYRIVDWSTATAAAVSDGVVVVLPAAGEHTVTEVDATSDADATPVLGVTGGATRSESVRRGLAAIPDDVGIVLVHDAARPVASSALFRRVIDAVEQGADAVVPTVAVVDTLRTRSGEALDRDAIEAVQTPQGFSTAMLRRAHAGQSVATDDATLVAEIGGKVEAVNGERWNLKVTDPRDELVAAALLADRRDPAPFDGEQS